MAIREAIKKVNLTGHENKKMMELSGGMRKRVGIAQLLMRKPSESSFLMNRQRDWTLKSGFTSAIC